MNRGDNGRRGKWLAAGLVTIGVIAAVVGYIVRPVKSRPPATQPNVAQTVPGER